MIAALLLAALGGFTDWTAPDWDGRGARCEERGGRVRVEVCEVGSQVVSISCRDEDGQPATCPGWAHELAWMVER